MTTTTSSRPRQYLGLDPYPPSQCLVTPPTFNRSDAGDEADDNRDDDDCDGDDDDHGEDDYDDNDDDTSYLQQV